MDANGIMTAVEVLAPQAVTTAGGAVTGSGIDTAGYEGNLKLILDSAAGGAGATLDVAVQESDDNVAGHFAAFSPAIAFTQVGNAASLQSLAIPDTAKRYIRVVATPAGVGGSFECVVVFVGEKQYN